MFPKFLSLIPNPFIDCVPVLSGLLLRLFASSSLLLVLCKQGGRSDWLVFQANFQPRRDIAAGWLALVALQ